MKIAIAAAFAGLLSGQCADPGASPAPPQSQTQSCGEDVDCFLRAAQTCAPATMTAATYAQGSEQQKGTTFLQIRGPERGNCIVYMRIENVEMVFPPEIPPQIVADARKKLEAMRGRDGVCRFTNAELVDLLTRLKARDYSSTAWRSKCEGEIFPR